MDFRAVLILVSVLIAQASCQPVGNRASEAVKATIKLIQGVMQTAWRHLQDASELLPSVSCSSLNMTELLGLEQQPLLANTISTLSCYTQKFSKRISELSANLTVSVQYMQDVEKLLSCEIKPKNCSLPRLEQDLDYYIYAKCFLQLAEERLGSSKPTQLCQNLLK